MKRTSFIHLSHALSALLLLGAAPAFALDIMVSAASSLTNAFNEIGKAYEREHQDMRVLFNFGASGVLLQQISRGAPVDVLATADQETMERAQTQNLIYRESRANFAANSGFEEWAVRAATGVSPFGSLSRVKSTRRREIRVRS